VLFSIQSRKKTPSLDPHAAQSIYLRDATLRGSSRCAGLRSLIIYNIYIIVTSRRSWKRAYILKTRPVHKGNRRARRATTKRPSSRLFHRHHIIYYTYNVLVLILFMYLPDEDRRWPLKSRHDGRFFLLRFLPSETNHTRDHVYTYNPYIVNRPLFLFSMPNKCCMQSYTSRYLYICMFDTFVYNGLSLVRGRRHNLTGYQL